MKFEEILQDFLNFKAIKGSHWPNHENIRINECGQIVNNTGNDYSFDQFSLSHSWELYEEPLKELTLQEAVKIVENGGNVWNNKEGSECVYYMHDRGCGEYKKDGHSVGWEMEYRYFGYIWYEVKL